MQNTFNRVTSVRKSGSSSITTIPKEVARMLDLDVGDKVEYIVDTDSKVVEITKYNPEKYKNNPSN